jgi:hypothetical protein
MLRNITECPGSRVIDSHTELLAVFLCSMLTPTNIEKFRPSVSSEYFSSEKLKNLPSSRHWLMNCLNELPATILTIDEKQRLIAEIDRHVNESRPKERLIRVIVSELDIVYRRAKNYRSL